MTYQELQRIIPDGKLHSGKDKKPEEKEQPSKAPENGSEKKTKTSPTPEPEKKN